MPRLLLFVPCQVAIIDSSSNVLSTINVIEGMNLAQFPGALPELSIVTSWRRYDDESDASMVQKVDLVNPDGVGIFSQETPFLFERLGHRVVNRIGGVSVQAAGPYELQVRITRQGTQFSQEPQASYPLIIQQMPRVHRP